MELVEQAMALIGGRWKPAIMYCLNVWGTQRFSQLRRQIPGVSQRMLTKQLRDLERHGLVERTFFEQVPPRVDYTATDLGRTLHPIYKSVCEWSGAKWGQLQAAQKRYDVARSRRAQGLAAERSSRR